MFKKNFRRYAPLLVIMSLLSVVVMFSFYYLLKPEKILPIYSPNMVATELVDESIQYVKKYHRIADFSLINQNGDSVSSDFYRNKIYVADFFFTTCPTICPIMTDNMSYIQEQTKNQDVQLVSFSVTPEIDSVQQLKKYALEKGVNDKKWNLLTGNKKRIYELARKSFLVAKDDGDGGKYDMIHTENFVLIDKEKRIRGFYDGTNKEEMDLLLDDILTLENSN